VSSSSEDEEAELILDEEDDSQLLSSLDPKEWKVRKHLVCFIVVSCCVFCMPDTFVNAKCLH